MYHDLLSLPSSPPGLQPTARRPVEPCINRPLPSPPPHCVAHIMSSRPWHCHCTIARLNYLNAAVIILPPHSRRGAPRPNHRSTRLPGGQVPAQVVHVVWAGAMRAGVVPCVRGSCGHLCCETCQSVAARVGGRVFCGRDLLVMSGYQLPPSYHQFTGSPLEFALARHVWQHQPACTRHIRDG